jgi:hypothetical protein
LAPPNSFKQFVTSQIILLFMEIIEVFRADGNPPESMAAFKTIRAFATQVSKQELL